MAAPVAMQPYHHDAAPPAGQSVEKNALQAFIDSDPGQLLSNILHSVGALAFIAGIAVYLYVAHHVRRGLPMRAEAGSILNWAHAFTLGGILLNGVGGLMRLYESDHPGLDHLASSQWVQVLLAKHVFLILGVGLAILLVLRTAKLSRRPDVEPLLRRESPRMATFAVASLLTILMASVLGSVAANVDLRQELGLPPLTSGDDAGPGGNNGGQDPGTAPRPLVPSRMSTGGTITGTPAFPGLQSHLFSVAAEASGMNVTLTWTTGQAALSLRVKDPQGNVATGEVTARGTTGLTAKFQGPIAAGDWTLEVSSQQAVNEQYSLAATTAGQWYTIQGTATLTPGSPTDFFEANLETKKGTVLYFDWSVEASDAKVHFNCHLHDGDKVEYPIRGEWNRLSGNYTHERDDPGVSFMWQANATGPNAHTVPVRVHYRIWGDFTVHSYAPSQ